MGWRRLSRLASPSRTLYFGWSTSPGCSDGIQIGSAIDKCIGPGNEFTGKFQGNGVAHPDPIRVPRTIRC